MREKCVENTDKKDFSDGLLLEVFINWWQMIMEVKRKYKEEENKITANEH